MTVSQSDRDAMVQKMQAAIDKVKAHDDWVKNHPNLKQDLGADYESYQNYVNNLGALSTNATIAYQKFGTSDPAVWQTVSAQEWNDAETWVLMANSIYDVIARHPTGGAKPLPGKPGAAKTPAPAPAPAGGVNPLLIGAGVVAVGLVAVAALS